MTRRRKSAARALEFATRLRKARTAEGLTLRALSKRTGISESSLSRFESADSSPSFDDVCLVSRVLGWPLLYFATGHERSGADPRHLATRLRFWGLSDLPTDALLGEARPFEELVVEALSDRSTARLIEAVPALLLRNDFDRAVLSKEASGQQLLHRIGWACELAEWIATQIPLHSVRPDALPRVRELRAEGWKHRRKDDWDYVGRNLHVEDIEKVASSLKKDIERTPLVTRKWKLIFETSQARFLDRAREILGVANA